MAAPEPFVSSCAARKRTPSRRDVYYSFIAQSHISLHTFPARGMVHADVFSCESFDVGRALRLLRTAFHPQRVDWHLLDRGTEFPRDIAGSRALVEKERRRLATALGLEAMR